MGLFKDLCKIVISPMPHPRLLVYPEDLEQSQDDKEQKLLQYQKEHKHNDK